MTSTARSSPPGVARVGDRVRLLGRHVFLAEDGISYVAGQRGYRMLTGEFVRDQALFCRDEKLAYLAVHNHFGADSVSFSSDDLRSHERGYPALRDVTRRQIVGGVVFAKNAAAGDLWLDSGRAPLKVVRALGANIVEMYPRAPARLKGASVEYDRQARLFRRPRPGASRSPAGRNHRPRRDRLARRRVPVAPRRGRSRAGGPRSPPSPRTYRASSGARGGMRCCRSPARVRRRAFASARLE